MGVEIKFMTSFMVLIKEFVEFSASVRLFRGNEGSGSIACVLVSNCHPHLAFLGLCPLSQDY